MKKETTAAHIPNTIKKLVELPVETAAGLILLASKSKKKTATKPYMEKVLIDHEKKNNKRDSKNRLV